jgi:hypothetical protein
MSIERLCTTLLSVILSVLPLASLADQTGLLVHRGYAAVVLMVASSVILTVRRLAFLPRR